ncbi:unnamed protein product [Haemonchus placei]|uniref:WD_REPEATS_REGION domain-containing protein n=1 Tax=Haemonchus placei TaxID=6290 RepID=A0A0N4WDF7_HAEPC|nr:unnamed protein product [Haemonchus placei]
MTIIWICSSKKEPPVIVTSKIPLFCLKKLGPRHVLVAGGGGESKTGVSNLIQVLLDEFVILIYIDTDIYATMNMDVVCCADPEKGRYLIAAGHGQVSSIRICLHSLQQNLFCRCILRFCSSDSSKCVRFDRSTSGKRVVTGGEDGRIRVWNTEALVEDRPILDIEAHKSDVFDIDVTFDGRTIMYAHLIATLCSFFARSIRCTPLGSDGNIVFVAAYNAAALTSKKKSFLALWAFSREKKALRSIVVRSIGQGDGVSSLCVSPCGNYTGVGSMGGSVYIYDTHDMKEMIAFKETHGIFVTAVEFLDRYAADIPGPGAVARASLISLSADQTIQVSILQFRLSIKFLLCFSPL